MINVNVICIGKLKEKYLVDAISEYQKRLSAFCKLNIIELSEEKLPDNPSTSLIEKGLIEEGKKIDNKIQKGSYTISMCIEGQKVPSEKLAQKIEEISLNNSTINFIIGSSFGLSKDIKDKSNFKLSMSDMTFPHQLARVMLLEQIYRAFGIINNTKYHK